MEALSGMRSPHTQRDIPLDNIDDFLLTNECTVCKAMAGYHRGATLLKGVVCVTNYQVLFIAASPRPKSLRNSGGLGGSGAGKGAAIEQKIPLGLIDHLETAGESKEKSGDAAKRTATLAIHCKDGRLCRFQFRNAEDEKRIYHHITTFAFPVIRTNLFAFYNTPTAKSHKKVVDLYPHEQESDDEDSDTCASPQAARHAGSPPAGRRFSSDRSALDVVDGGDGDGEEAESKQEEAEAPSGHSRTPSDMTHKRSLSKTAVYATKHIAENEFVMRSSPVETVVATTSGSKETSSMTETETDIDDDMEDPDEGDLMMFDGWDIFNPKLEYLRLGVRVGGKELRKKLPKHLRSLQDASTMSSSPIFKSKWRLSRINRNYDLCPTYPRYIAIPRGIKEEELRSVVEFRSKGRLPILCYIHRETYASICRSAQPLARLGFSRCVADERLLELIRTSGLNPNAKLHILDARPRLNAMAQQATGKGCENLNWYNNTEYEFMGIENIHVMRDSLKKVFQYSRECLHEVACTETEGGEVHIMETLREIQNSGWLEHLRIVLKSVDRIVNLIHAQGSSVVVHCSDGWDRTSQLTSLAMLRVDPYYRTIEGFEVLIEKEWIAAGHQFQQRCGHGEHNTANDRNRSPIYLQFLDCVWQMLAQQPNEFEFNEMFLLFLAESVYSCRFGTFLFNCEMDRREKDVYQTTTSLWSYTNCNPRFLNPRYKQQVHGDGRDVVRHSKIQVLDVDADDVQLWMNYYLPSMPSSMKQVKFHAAVPKTNSEEQLRKRIKELENGQNQLLKTIHGLETENRRLLVDNEHLLLQNLNLLERIASAGSDAA